MYLWVSTVRKGGGGACDVFEAEDSINTYILGEGKDTLHLLRWFGTRDYQLE